MIHSMSGWVMSDIQFLNFAKVEIDGEGVFWYISNIIDLEENDLVLVPFGNYNELKKGKVLRIDKNVSSQNAPVPVKRMKEISQRLSK